MIAPRQASVSSVVPAQFNHLFDVVYRQIKHNGNNPALYFANEIQTYEFLGQRISAIADQLRSAGIKQGDRVGLFFPNHVDYVASFFAVSALAATIVPINPLLKSEEIAHILSDSGARFLILHDSVFDEAIKSFASLSCLEYVFVSGTSKDLANNAQRPKLEKLTDRLVSLELLNICQDIDPQKDLALLVYTSGTTGKPKGAMLTHENLLSIFPGELNVYGFNQDDRILAILPMCHIFGIVILLIGAIAYGSALVLMPKFDAARTLSLIEQLKITVLPAVPSIYQFLLLEHAERPADLSSLRLGFSGGAALSQTLLQEAENTFQIPIMEGYALTETSCATTLNRPDRKRKPGSVGAALPGLKIAITNEKELPLPPGEQNIGEIWVQGPNVMLGYYQQSEATQEVFSQSWFKTGDLGYLDQEGFLYVIGRKKELIIRGGQNIYPKEIEDVLARLEAVLESAVIGIPDQYMGERVKAYIVKRPGSNLREEDIKQFCAEHLAEYKVPRLVEFIPSLPRNSTGKLLKRLLS